jgi:hypothetical protein
MKILYSDQSLVEEKYDNSIFLAGPTPRSEDVKSWRPQAIEYYNKYNFNGILFVPERENWIDGFVYEDQIEWEQYALEKANVILFWVPRCLKNMPAFTTNVEFGFYTAKSPEKVLHGRPDDSVKNRYLDILYKKHCNKDYHNSLEELVLNSIQNQEVNNVS